MHKRNACLLIVFLIYVGVSACGAQDAENREQPGPNVAKLDEHKKKIIARTLLDPPRLVTKRQVFALLHNRSIRDEISFSYKRYLVYSEIDRKANLEVSGLSINNMPEIMDLAEKRALYRALEEEIRGKAIESIEALFEPQQLDRLNQLVHYVEIAYLGLNVAMADGRLEKDIGITENQKTHIRTIGQKILDEAELVVARVRKDSHATILQLLTPQQQEEADRILGEYSTFIDIFAQLGLHHNGNLRDEAALRQAETKQPFSDEDLAKERGSVLVGNPSEEVLLFTLMLNKGMWNELKLNEDQISVIHKIKVKGNYSGMNLIETAKEILHPDQQARVKQVAWYREITMRGYARAITAGFLGAALKIEESQKPQLLESISKLENQRDAEIKAVRSQAQERILRELATEQQQVASKLLGEYFEFIDPSILSRRESYGLYLERKNQTQ